MFDISVDVEYVGSFFVLDWFFYVNSNNTATTGISIAKTKRISREFDVFKEMFVITEPGLWQCDYVEVVFVYQ